MLHLFHESLEGSLMLDLFIGQALEQVALITLLHLFGPVTVKRFAVLFDTDSETDEFSHFQQRHRDTSLDFRIGLVKNFGMKRVMGKGKKIKLEGKEKRPPGDAWGPLRVPTTRLEGYAVGRSHASPTAD